MNTYKNLEQLEQENQALRKTVQHLEENYKRGSALDTGGTMLGETIRGMGGMNQAGFDRDAYLAREREKNHDECSHHQPSSAGIASIRNIRLGAENFMNIIDANTHPCADVIDAKRKVHEAMMTANKAVVLQG